MDTKRINELIDKYANGTATSAEEREINEWYRETAYRDAEFPDNEDETYHSMLETLNKATKPKFNFKNSRKWSLAATITVFLATGITLYFTNHNAKKESVKLTKNLILPGKIRAVLTLANGKKIYLNDAADGDLATQGNIQVIKTKKGQLIYTVRNSTSINGSAINPGGPIGYNTIETPAGGQYQIILPDQSKVWLNAMSSIKFPVSFSRFNERRIELSGEAYFEVEHDKEHPFKVVTAKQEVEDLGTHFDVNAYTDEPSAKTTLLEGSVKINAGGETSLLKPGQQVKVTSKLIISDVNTQAVIAWKNGYFMFDDERLDDIMRQVARWYNIKVIYNDDNVKNETFGVLSTRFANISVLLNLMEESGNAHFEINGSTITIGKR